MRRSTFEARLRAGAAVLAAAALLCACGGGGDAGGTLTVVFDYGAQQSTPTRSVEYCWYDSNSPVGGASTPGAVVPGAHYVIVSGSLAPGTSLDASTGVVSGYPSATGTYAATVQLTVSGYKGAATSTLTQQVYPITIEPQTFSTVNNLSSVILQIGYLDSLGGGVTEDRPHGLTLDYHLAAGSAPLPPGMTLDSHSGQIQGTFGAPAGVYAGIVMEASVINPQSTHTYTLAPYTLTVVHGGG